MLLSSVVVVFRNVSLRASLIIKISLIIRKRASSIIRISLRASVIIRIGKIREAVVSKPRIKVAEVVSCIHRVSLAVVSIPVVMTSFLF